jgi:hypothetical protein
MSIVITIIAVIAALIAVSLITALFTKKGYMIEREIIINRPIHDVFNFIKHLKNQDRFSKWVMMDPNMKKEYHGADGTVGFVYAWDGNKKAGKGEQEIVNITEGERVDIEVRFLKPFKGIAITPFTTVPLSNPDLESYPEYPGQTKLTWGMNSTLKYPMNLMLLFMDMDKILGKDIQSSLVTLKRILEKN